MKPPTLAGRVMRWSLAADERAAVLGDLEEEFAAIAAERGTEAAHRWYWRQTLSSAAPNAIRRVRRAYLREFGDPEARTAQRQAKKQSYWFIGIAAAFMVVDVLVFRRLDQFAAFPLGLGLLFFVFSYFETGRRRQPKPGEGLIHIVLVGCWAWSTLKNYDSRFFLGTIAISNVLQRWPRRLWPVPARRQPPSYSVRTPIVTFRQADGSMFSTTTVSTEIMALDRPVLGLAKPAPIPDEYQTDGVVPMMPVLARAFPSSETIRVFSVMNANPELLTATLEVRALPEDRVVRRLPVSVTKATPKLPARIEAALDERDRPKLATAPMSELDVVVPLEGLTPGKYCLRLVATEGTMNSSQDEAIEVLAEARG